MKCITSEQFFSIIKLVNFPGLAIQIRKSKIENYSKEGPLLDSTSPIKVV